MDQVGVCLICPITGDTVTEPVVACDGFTYNRKAIEQWIESCKKQKRLITSPMTGEALENLTMTPNRMVRDVLENWEDLQEEIERKNFLIEAFKLKLREKTDIVDRQSEILRWLDPEQKADVVRELQRKVNRYEKMNESLLAGLGSYNITAKLVGCSMSFSLCVHSAMKIGAVMDAISDRGGPPVHQQRLVFGGKQMHEDGTLGDYSVLPKDEVHIVLSMRGD